MCETNLVDLVNKQRRYIQILLEENEKLYKLNKYLRASRDRRNNKDGRRATDRGD